MKNTQVFVGIFLFMAVLVFALAGCGSSGSSDSAWWGGGDSGGTPVTTPQVQTLTNLNNPGQPIRQGDWTQIDGTGFGATQGAGYVLYTLEDGSKGNADMYGSWSDTQITCRVPVTVSKDAAAKGTWGAQVFTDNGGSSNDFPTAGNPTPNPTPTDIPPSPTPTPTQSVSPTPSPTTTVSPTPSPTATSGGGGGGGGGGGATAQWWDLGFAETVNSIWNIQVGADQAGNVYVSCEGDDCISVYEGESDAKGFRNLYKNMTLVGNFPTGTGKYSSHSLFVPQDTSKTYGIAYRNATSLVIHKASVSSGTSSFKNVTSIKIPEEAGFNSPSLYLSGNDAYVSYGFSYNGSNYVGVNYIPIPTSTPYTYNDWNSGYRNPNQGSVPGRNCTISKGTSTALFMGYLQPTPTPSPGGGSYTVGSYQISPTSSPSPAPSWTPCSSGSVPVLDNNVRVTNNGTSPYYLAYASTTAEWSGLNLFGIAASGSSAGYFLAVGTPPLNVSSVTASGTPIVANGKKTVTYSYGGTLNVMQNSSSTGPWTNIKTFTAIDNQFGVGTTVNGAPLISYFTYDSSYGTYGIRTQAYTSTTPKIIAQREFIRATFLCCYAGVKFPLPRL